MFQSLSVGRVHKQRDVVSVSEVEAGCSPVCITDVAVNVTQSVLFMGGNVHMLVVFGEYSS